MNRRFQLAILAALSGVLATLAVTNPWQRSGSRAAAASGGTLTASVRNAPDSFNPFTGRPDVALDVVTRLLHATLVRIDRRSDQVEPWLAERIDAEADGVTYTLPLRPGLVFSDGTPVTSDDVVASVAAAANADAGSYLADMLLVRGRPIQVGASDTHTVTVRLPIPYGPGIRMLAEVPIVPASRLRAAKALDALWPSTVTPSELVGLGPFVLSRYEAGQRVVFARNPRYWRRDAAGQPLPYLDRLVLEVVSDQNNELLRLMAGQLDMLATESRAEDVATLRRAEQAGRLTLVDVGPALDANALWFNLRPDKWRSDGERQWLQRDEFRRAISHAVDRRGLADAVYLGLADPVYGPVTPANVRWHSPFAATDSFDPRRARELLASIGLRDRNGDGTLDDGAGAAVRFVLLTQAGNTVRERAAAFIRDELRRIGVHVDVAAVEVGALFERFQAGNYDAMYFGLQNTATDPSSQLNFWLSSGDFHVWHPRQKRPAREWEREIDALMMQQVATTHPERRREIFDRVQRIFHRHAPAIYFAAPRIIVAMSSRVRNATPAVLQPQVLWNPDTLAIR